MKPRTYRTLEEACRVKDYLGAIETVDKWVVDAKKTKFWGSLPIPDDILFSIYYVGNLNASSEQERITGYAYIVIEAAKEANPDYQLITRLMDTIQLLMWRTINGLFDTVPKSATASRVNAAHLRYGGTVWLLWQTLENVFRKQEDKTWAQTQRDRLHEELTRHIIYKKQ